MLPSLPGWTVKVVRGTPLSSVTYSARQGNERLTIKILVSRIPADVNPSAIKLGPALGQDARQRLGMAGFKVRSVRTGRTRFLGDDAASEQISGMDRGVPFHTSRYAFRNGREEYWFCATITGRPAGDAAKRRMEYAVAALKQGIRKVRAHAPGVR
ncbi:MAG: hypothetical protein ACP5VE_14555 [Chthonomonadales bacterium]